MKKLTLMILTAAICIKAKCQILPQWVDTISVQSPLNPQFTDMKLDKHGNSYVLASVIGGFPSTEFILAKYNSSGIPQFIIDSVNYNVNVKYLEIDDSMNVYIAGVLGTANFSGDMLLMKFDSSGNSLWTQTFSWGFGMTWHNPYAITHDNSGNILIAGVCDTSAINGTEDYLTLKYNPAGNLIWAKRYNHYLQDDAYAIVTDQYDNVYVTGRSDDSLTDFNIVTIKYDSAGVQQWDKRFIHNNDISSPVSIKVSLDGNCFIGAIHIPASLGDANYLTLRYDSAGNLMWSSIYEPGGGNGGEHWITSIGIDDSVNVYVTGTMFINNGTAQKFFTMKYDSAGSIKWTKSFNPGVNGNHAYSLVLDNSANVFVSGNSDFPSTNEIVTVKYDRNGNFIWSANYIPCPTCGAVAYKNKCDTTGALYIQGIFGDLNSSGLITLKYGNSVGVSEILPQNKLNIFPNPSNGNFLITFNNFIQEGVIEINNVLGENVLKENIYSTSTKEFNLKNISQGIYFVKVFDENKLYCKKIIIE